MRIVLVTFQFNSIHLFTTQHHDTKFKNNCTRYIRVGAQNIANEMFVFRSYPGQSTPIQVVKMGTNFYLCRPFVFQCKLWVASYRQITVCITYLSELKNRFCQTWTSLSPIQFVLISNLYDLFFNTLRVLSNQICSSFFNYLRLSIQVFVQGHLVS